MFSGAVPVAALSVAVPRERFRPTHLAPAVRTAALGLSRTLRQLLEYDSAQCPSAEGQRPGARKAASKSSAPCSYGSRRACSECCSARSLSAPLWARGSPSGTTWSSSRIHPYFVI
ncbi:hypothetical protein [Acrocarpospora macrocephala]|uniref:hypothetical protein n=1 Tax=Acrocarpospora macrocephala TaxID=150177 RepID=UPI001FE618CF|nr:hypothetical protein [Acrocarpospora macrocephala]